MRRPLFFSPTDAYKCVICLCLFGLMKDNRERLLDHSVLILISIAKWEKIQVRPRHQNCWTVSLVRHFLFCFRHRLISHQFHFIYFEMELQFGSSQLSKLATSFWIQGHSCATYRTTYSSKAICYKLIWVVLIQVEFNGRLQRNLVDLSQRQTKSRTLYITVKNLTMEKSKNLTLLIRKMDYSVHSQLVLRWNPMLSNNHHPS